MTSKIPAVLLARRTSRPLAVEVPPTEADDEHRQCAQADQYAEAGEKKRRKYRQHPRGSAKRPPAAAIVRLSIQHPHPSNHNGRVTSRTLASLSSCGELVAAARQRATAPAPSGRDGRCWLGGDYSFIKTGRNGLTSARPPAREDQDGESLRVEGRCAMRTAARRTSLRNGRSSQSAKTTATPPATVITNARRSAKSSTRRVAAGCGAWTVRLAGVGSKSSTLLVELDGGASDEIRSGSRSGFRFTARPRRITRDLAPARPAPLQAYEV